jgi:hypothetical protein
MPPRVIVSKKNQCLDGVVTAVPESPSFQRSSSTEPEYRAYQDNPHAPRDTRLYWTPQYRSGDRYVAAGEDALEWIPKMDQPRLLDDYQPEIRHHLRLPERDILWNSLVPDSARSHWRLSEWSASAQVLFKWLCREESCSPELARNLRLLVLRMDGETDFRAIVQQQVSSYFLEERSDDVGTAHFGDATYRLSLVDWRVRETQRPIVVGNLIRRNWYAVECEHGPSTRHDDHFSDVTGMFSGKQHTFRLQFVRD